MAGRAEVAFLGTGMMGLPMVSRLIDAGYGLRVWNRTLSKTKPLAEKGARICANAAQAVDGAEFICLCLTDARAIKDVLGSETELVIAPGTIIVDFSTIGVEESRELSTRIASKAGAYWLDCPVSGGVAGANTGSLTIFAGGAEAALNAARPLLARVSARVTHVGGAGAGQAAKLCNQLIVSTSLAAIAEALALAENLGLDPTQLVDALQGGFADSKPLQIFGSRMAKTHDPGPKVAEIHTMLKDVDAIERIAKANSMRTPLLDCVRGLYKTMIEAGRGSDDLPALIDLYRRHLLRRML